MTGFTLGVASNGLMHPPSEETLEAFEKLLDGLIEAAKAEERKEDA
ncbi:hypothetical protein Q7C18_02680 [Nesterenkonia sp. CL21]|nr:hypothetical protein [Nesterenkonia sp. CL21]MDS2171594.1 hypothetical protein [Nesterenkonia sp. CL21]